MKDTAVNALGVWLNAELEAGTPTPLIMGQFMAEFQGLFGG